MMVKDTSSSDDGFADENVQKEKFEMINYSNLNTFSFKLASQLEIPHSSVDYNMRVCQKTLNRKDLSQVWKLVGVALKNVDKAKGIKSPEALA